MRKFLLPVAALLAAACSASAGTMTFFTSLNGANEAPPNASPGIGSAQLDIDTDAHTYRIQATFSGLLGNTTAAHIHGATAAPGAGTAGVMTSTPSYPGFPNGVTAGSYDMTFDMTLASTWNPAFVTAQGGIANAETAFINSVIDGRAYLNIHSSSFGAGEIRGFWAVPEPTSLSLLALAGAAGALRRR